MSEILTLPGVSAPHITDAQLDTLDDLHRAANPGPWKIVYQADYQHENWLIADLGAFDGDSGPDTVLITTDGVNASRMCGDALTDGEFIVAAQKNLPSLVAEIRRLRGLLRAQEGASYGRV